MRLFGVLIFLFVSAFALAELNQDLQKELMDMLEKDQDIRNRVEQLGFDNISPELHEEWLQLDWQNTRRLKKMIEDHGWMDKSLVGEKGVGAAFMIVQHSPDEEFQRAMLPQIMASYENGEGITGQDVALLTDRVLVNQGEMQIYGTQASIEEGKVEFFPIKDEADVDQRRMKMGMISLEEYKRLIEEHYGFLIPSDEGG